MSASAIMMMVFAILLLWGGLIAAILKLRGHPDKLEPEPESARGRGGPGSGPSNGAGAHRAD